MMSIIKDQEKLIFEVCLKLSVSAISRSFAVIAMRYLKYLAWHLLFCYLER
jgi:hypothetical protein